MFVDTALRDRESAGRPVVYVPETSASKEDLARVWVMRRVLNPLSPVEQMEVVLERLEKTKSNAEFLASMQS